MRSPAGIAITFAALALCGADFTMSQPAHAADPLVVPVTLKGDAFTPAEIKVPQGQPFVMKFINQDAVAAEIEAKDFKIEKVVAGASEIIANVGPQPAGRYLFVNEYKEDTVKGFIVVE